MSEPELPFFRVVQRQQDVGVFANPTDEVLDVDVQIKAGDFLWRRILFQHHLNASKRKSRKIC